LPGPVAVEQGEQFGGGGHRSTPAAAYQARPKATPGDRTADTHDRVRRDIIDKTGCVTLRHGGTLYHLGIGRPHTGTHVLLPVTGPRLLARLL
jgi:hypothetical protein